MGFLGVLAFWSARLRARKSLRERILSPILRLTIVAVSSALLLALELFALKPRRFFFLSDEFILPVFLPLYNKYYSKIVLQMHIKKFTFYFMSIWSCLLYMCILRYTYKHGS